MKLINYPAMASPASVDFIKPYLKSLRKKSRVLDPFCGTGRLLVYARLTGHDTTGTDCSPIAILAARVLHQRTNYKSVERQLIEIEQHFKQVANTYQATAEDLFWFSESAYNNLRSVLSSIEEVVTSRNTRRFFWLALVNTSRSASYTRENEYKSHRIKPDARRVHQPNIWKLFSGNCRRLSNCLIPYNTNLDGNYRLILGDIQNYGFYNSSFDAVVTSPPYGDSISTVGYGQYARTPLLVLKCSSEFKREFPYAYNEGAIDGICLGGKRCSSSNVTCYPHIVRDAMIGTMKKFSQDYFSRLDTISNLLADKALCCFVLADRTYRGKKFPLIQSTKEHMLSLGFRLVNFHERFLSLKRLPRTMQHLHDRETESHDGMNYETILIFSR